MKKKLILLSLCSVLPGYSSIITVGDFTGGLIANDGTAIAAGTGFFAAGFLNTPVSFANSSSITSDEFAAFVSSFTQTGSSGVSGQGATGTAGFTQFNADAGRIDTSNAAFGQEVFLVAGNGSTLAASTEIAVFSSGQNFVDDSATPTQAAFNISYAPANIVVGDNQGDVAFGQPVTRLAGITVVPEPSSALLLGLAATCGLVRRRK